MVKRVTHLRSDPNHSDQYLTQVPQYLVQYSPLQSLLVFSLPETVILTVAITGDQPDL